MRLLTVLRVPLSLFTVDPVSRLGVLSYKVISVGLLVPTPPSSMNRDPVVREYWQRHGRDVDDMNMMHIEYDE